MRIGYAIFLVSLIAAGSAWSAPTIDGSIGTGEGWVMLSEAVSARPLTGGQSGSSDLVGESATQYRWDGSDNVLFDDNRGDTISLYAAFDSTYLYLGATGPTVPFNAWDNTDPDGNNDQGDVFIAVDTSSSASGNLSANDGHTTFNGGARAVDFNGWSPNYVVGVQFVDNGGGGNGYANVEQTVSHTVVGGEAQGQNNGGFDWAGGINSAASYDTFNNNAGEFEFAIPWTMLGFSEAPLGEEIRFGLYTTGNDVAMDTYDSAPGVGQASVYEQLGDAPGDVDTEDRLGAVDDNIVGSEPSSNFVSDDLGRTPGHDDEIDTIEEYLIYTIPEPSTAILLGVGCALFAVRRRMRR